MFPKRTAIRLTNAFCCGDPVTRRGLCSCWSGRCRGDLGNIHQLGVHERAERLHGHDAAAVAAESGGEDASAIVLTTTMPGSGTDKDYIVCKIGVKVSAHGHGGEVARLLPVLPDPASLQAILRRCASDGGRVRSTDRQPGTPGRVTATGIARVVSGSGRLAIVAEVASIRRTPAPTTTSASSTTTRASTPRPCAIHEGAGSRSAHEVPAQSRSRVSTQATTTPDSPN